MSVNSSICPKCDALVKGDVCLNCGYVLPDAKPQEKQVESAAKYNKEGKDKFENTEDVKLQREDVPQSQEKPKIRSIFTDLICEGDKIPQEEDLVSTVKRSKIVPVVLAVILLVLGVISYWRFVYFTPGYISPLVLSAWDIKKVNSLDINGENVEKIPLTSMANPEKTIDLDTGLTEGNFEKNDFMRFAPPNINLVVHLFDIQKIFEKFLDDEALSAAMNEFDISSDDINVYLSDGFVLMYPGEDFATWGFVIQAREKSKEFIAKRLKDFNEKKEGQGYKFGEYYAELVEVPSEIQEMQDKDQIESFKESEENNSESSGSVDLYLLVSNSKEFLDQMKELSEGNLTNLKQDAEFAQSRANLPQVGQVFIYRQKDAKVWDLLSNWAVSQFDYVGLDKILKEVTSTGVAMYSVNGKLKIRSAGPF